jgi:DNA sulfur modification protein DndD
MIDFKLINVNISNFACYLGENRIDFTTESKKNIFLFKLLNGYGKTSFFHAIKWGFYGESIDYFKDSKQIEIKDFLNDKLDPAKNSFFVEISFKYGSEAYILTRSLKPGIERLSTLSLVKNGRKIPDRDEVQETLDQIIPKNFSDFFMFDGEQLSKFMTAQEKNFRDSIHQLLGLKQIRVLRDDLKRIKAKYDTKLVESKSNDQEVNDRKETIKGILRYIKNHELKIKEHDDKIFENEKTKEGLEGHRSEYENLPNIIRDIDLISEKEKKLIRDITLIKAELELNSKNLFINFIKKDLKKLLDENNKRLTGLEGLCGLSDKQADIEIVREDVLNKSVPICNVCGHKLDEKEIKKITHEKEKLKESLKTFEKNREERALIKNENKHLKEFIEKLGEFDFQKNLDDYKEKTSNLGELIKSRKVLQKESQREEYGNFANINRQISILEEENTKKRDHIKILKEEIKRYQDNIEEINRDIKRLGHDDKITQAVSSQVSYISKTIKLLDEALESGTQSKRKKIIEKSNEIFLEITNKPQEYKGIEFEDGESYAFIIKTSNNKTVTNPSKGEKQILAMSFLLGLNQYTGKNNVILMDTPVASLDNVHSAGIGKALSKLNNQVIFLAQPQELSGMIYKNMLPSIAKEFVVEREDYKSIIREVKNE